MNRGLFKKALNKSRSIKKKIRYAFLSLSGVFGGLKRAHLLACLILVFGVIAAGGVLTLSGFSTHEPIAGAESPQWTQDAGEGITVPACGSTTACGAPGQNVVCTTCSGNAPSVEFTWTNTGDTATLTCSTVRIGAWVASSPAVRILDNLPCNGSAPWTGASNATSYNYEVRYKTAIYTACTGGVDPKSGLCLGWTTETRTYPRDETVCTGGVDPKSGLCLGWTTETNYGHLINGGSFSTPNCVPAPVCSPATVTLSTGQSQTFSVTNGTTPFTWSAPSSSNPSGSGSTHNTSYSSAGPYTVTVTDSASRTSQCSVNVSAGAGSCTLTVPSVAAGSPVTATWSSNLGTVTSNSYTCTVNPLGSGPLPLLANGNQPFTMPSTAQTCTLNMADSSGKIATCNAPVTPLVVGSPVCSPASSNITQGGSVSFTASGGSGGYTWTAPTASPASGSGSPFNPSFPTVGNNQQVTLRDSNNNTNVCSVNVSPAAGGAGPTLSVTPSCDGAISRLGLSWTPYAGATQYNIRKCAGSSCTSYASAVGYFGDASWVSVGNVGAVTSYFDTAVSAGQTWSYVINTWDGDWGNPPSNISFATALSCGGGPVPDYIAVWDGSSATPPNGFVSQPYTFSGHVTNQGNLGTLIGTQASFCAFPLATFSLWWTTTNAGESDPCYANLYKFSDRAVPSLATGASSPPFTSDTWIPTFADLYVGVLCADSTNQINEVGAENNNCTYTNAFTISVGAGGGVDLQTTGITPANSTVTQGTPVQFTATVRNNGSSPSDEFDETFAIDYNNDQFPLYNANIGSRITIPGGLAATGQTTVISNTWTATCPSGGPPCTHRVWGIADIMNAVIESDESNNRESTLITVSAVPMAYLNVYRVGDDLALSSAPSGTWADYTPWPPATQANPANLSSVSAGNGALSITNVPGYTITRRFCGHAVGGSCTFPVAFTGGLTCNPSWCFDPSVGAPLSWVIEYQFRYSPIPVTLSVNLTASPNSQPAPLNTNLTATVSGSALGTMNYTFWWNCTDTSSDVSYVSQSSVCGDPTNPAIGAKFNGEAATSKSVSHTYLQNATAKVIVERGVAPAAQDQEAIIVSLVAACSVAPPSASVGNPVTWNSSATGGDGNYLFSWSGSDGLSCSGQPSPFCYAVTKVYSSTGSKNGTVSVTSASQSDTKSCGTANITPGTSIGATPPSILPSGSSILSWDSTGFGNSDCTIDQGIGAVTADGTKSVSPIVGTMYTITCNNGINSDSASAVVNVAGTPTIKEVPPQ